jgi:hypothetical protein
MGKTVPAALINVQGRGELHRELARCLRSGRAQRRPRGTVDRRGRIPGMMMLSQRPAEAEDRAGASPGIRARRWLHTQASP